MQIYANAIEKSGLGENINLLIHDNFLAYISPPFRLAHSRVDYVIRYPT